MYNVQDSIKWFKNMWTAHFEAELFGQWGLFRGIDKNYIHVGYAEFEMLNRNRKKEKRKNIYKLIRHIQNGKKKEKMLKQLHMWHFIYI